MAGIRCDSLPSEIFSKSKIGKKKSCVPPTPPCPAPPALFSLTPFPLLNVIILIALMPRVKFVFFFFFFLFFHRSQTLLLPSLSSASPYPPPLPRVLIIAPGCRQEEKKNEYQTDSSFEDLLSAVTVHCVKISVHFPVRGEKKQKKQNSWVERHGPPPLSAPPHASSLASPTTYSPAFLFHILVSFLDG